MIKVSGSTNVYAFGYDEETNQMYVQFLGGTSKNRRGPGPTYVYSGVGPTLYGGDTLLDAITAPAPGEWVWDHLRVRGSVSAHQHPYELIKVANTGYVPRQATAIGFRQRAVQTRRGVLRSALPGTGAFEDRRAIRKAFPRPQRGNRFYEPQALRSFEE